MKKRIFALALALCMMLSAMPTSFAGNGFLTLDGQENVEEQPREQQQEGILTLDDPDAVITQEPEEEPVYGVLTPDTPSEEPKAPVVEQSEGVLYVECPECGYLDGYHADDCPTIQPEEQEPVRQPETSLPAEDVPVVSTYSAENVSSAQTARTLTVVRNATAYAALTASLMTLSNESGDDGVAAQADERVDNSNIVTNKKVSGPDDDGAYTITLETFVTGQTTTTSTNVADAMDIILILDTSREMVTKTYSTTEVWNDWYAEGRNKSEKVWLKAKSVTLYYDVDGDKDTTNDRYPVTVTRDWQGGIIVGSWKYTATYNNGTSDIPIDDFQNQTYWTKTTTTTVTGSDNGAARLAALQTAANNFIDAIDPEGTTENNRRVALISYNSSSTVLTGVPTDGAYAASNDSVDAALRPVATEKALLKAEINALRVNTSAAASCETALYGAKQIFQSGNSTVPTTRPRIVILLSAGVFGPSGTLGNGKEGDGYTAMDMIWLSTILKANRGTIPEMDFTPNNSFYGYADRDESSFEKEYGFYDGCGATVYCVGLGMPTTEPAGAYYTTTTGTIASRINEVMYRVSSHRPDGTHTNKNMYNPWESLIQDPGNSRDDDWEGTYPDTLTRNVNKLHASYTSYFLTADDASELSGIFETISDSITTGGASIELDESTTVVDVVSDYFVLPDGADTNDIEVYMEDCTAVDTSGDETEYSWASRSQLWPIDDKPSDDIEVSVKLNSDDTVSVTGFDYSEYWVGKDSQTGVVHGKKLIIVFKVYVSDDFLGGEDIPTNGSGSHIENGGTVFEDFEPPTVDIPVDTSKVDLDWTTDVTVSDQTVYLSNTADLRDMLSIPGGSLFDGVNNKFVTVTFEIGDAVYTIAPGDTSGTWSGTYIVDLDECTTYEIACKINGSVVTTGEGENVTPNTKTVTVHVLKPSFTVTCADLWADYGQSITLDGAINASDDTIDYYISTAIEGWTDAKSHTGIPAADESKKPADTAFAYTYFVKQGEQEVTEHKVGTTDKTFTVELTSFNIGTFKGGTNWYTAPVAKTFTVFVNKFDLTITKNWADVEDCYKQDVIFTITGDYGTGENQNIQVVIPVGKTSVEVVGLLCGQSYSVAEANPEGINWAWRFTNTQKPNVTCNVKHDVISTTEHLRHTVNADFINSNPATKWFDAIASKFNIFRKGGN